MTNPNNHHVSRRAVLQVLATSMLASGCTMLPVETADKPQFSTLSSPLDFSTRPDRLFSAGVHYAIAIGPDREQILRWGLRDSGVINGDILARQENPEPVKLLPKTQFRSIAAGQIHSLALTESQNVIAWGYGNFGQLGSGQAEIKPGIHTVDLPDRIAIADAGHHYSMCLTIDGNLWTWGWAIGAKDPLRLGLTQNIEWYGTHGFYSTMPYQLPLPVPALDLAAGGNHVLALTVERRILSWGDNQHGELGNGWLNPQDLPTLISGIDEVAAVAAGGYHSMALRTDGSVLAWGWNSTGQIAGGIFTGQAESPQQIRQLSNISAISAGDRHSLALSADGSVWSWGSNVSGELGTNSTEFQSNTPQLVKGLQNIIAIDAGWDFSLALESNGTLWAWGSNQYGELGDGTTMNRHAPVQVSGVKIEHSSG